jgi:mRNA interferase RelE/StbE
LKNNIRRLSGTGEAIFRLRVGSYRVVFKKEKTDLVILFIRIGHRKNIYAKTDDNIV